MAVALPAIAVALSAIGTGVGTYSAFAQGSAAKDAARNQQKAENANALAATQAAALEAEQIRRQNRIRLGASRAAAAKSGVLINDSAADVMYDTSVQGELEAMSAIYSGATSATLSQNRGRAAIAEGRAASRIGSLRGAATLIQGLSETATGAAKAAAYYSDRKSNSSAPKMKGS